MGFVTGELQITATLANHNDARDTEDRVLWAEFAEEVKAIAARPQFEDLEIDVTDRGES
jgi:hypothetical protein